jgi:hypothetical protein
MSSPEIIEAVGSEVESDQIGHKAYILFSHVVQVIPRERVVQMQYSALAPSTNQSFISVDLAAVWLNYRF